MTNSPADLEIEVRQLKDRVRMLEALVRHSRNLLFTINSRGQITGLNEVAEQRLGWLEQEILGRHFDDFVSLASQGGEHFAATALITKSGERVPVEICKERHTIIAHDLADCGAVEESLRQAQKMETLGVLAGGIAHDFNNLLTGILGYAYLLQNEPDLVDRFGEGIEVIVKSSERAAQLTAQLLGFVRHNQGALIPVDLHLTIQEIVELLHRTIDKKIRVSANLNAADCHVNADASQMYQVLLNLCLNSRDAMPNGGELRLHTRNSGSNIVVSVTDSGIGIPEDIQSRIFEPFFTTKEKDRGTGIGLAMVRAIVRNHGGWIRAESEPGSGSTFYFTLPIAAKGGDVAPARRQAQKGTGQILIIEDEEFVRQVLTRMLGDLGYTVTCAGDVAVGVEYYRTNHSAIDLVILDLVMPTMNGLECLEALRLIDPDVKVILSSGYGHGQIDDVEFLPKPYQLEQLADVVQRALRARAFTAAVE
jgi:two-component system, cell cycle sensor histidine kinase and response regulator CckA